jgi:hypothetical protein
MLYAAGKLKRTPFSYESGLGFFVVGVLPKARSVARSKFLSVSGEGVSAAIRPDQHNDLDPERFLRDVLSRIADHRIIEELLPWNLVAGSV